MSHLFRAVVLIVMRRLFVRKGNAHCLKLSVPEFTINWDEVQAAISPKTRMIIINTPHNPSAQVLEVRTI